ncbi:hypothetical protein OSTOST_09506, partial [Ostertagia ostertagi]
DGIPLARETLLLQVVNEIYDDLTSDEKHDATQRIAQYLGDDALSPVRRTLTDFPQGKDLNKLTSLLHEYRLRLIIKCRLPEWSTRMLMSLMSSNFTRYVGSCIQYNERGAEVSTFFASFTSYAEDKCAELLELANLNTPVALILSQCLLDTCRANPLSEEWASIVFALAVFGPIPKKEQRVLDAAYEMIYEERVNEFDDEHRPFEVLQRTRLNGICVALRLAEENSKFANYLVEHIITETNVLNKSSSRSFGLSLAHRQNTRAAALLLLVADYVHDE